MGTMLMIDHQSFLSFLIRYNVWQKFDVLKEKNYVGCLVDHIMRRKEGGSVVIDIFY